MWSVLLAIGLLLVLLKLLVIWLEPKMAFFPIPGVQQTPDSAGVRYSDLRIGTSDGETLHGWWLEQPDPRAQVIFWHGNGGNLSLWLDLVLELHAHGFSVLAVDYRGYGASTGVPSQAGIYRDAEAVTREFHRRLARPDRPVLYWGRSLGSTIAAASAASHAPDGLVLESPIPDARSVLRANPALWALSFLSSYTFETSKHLRAYTGPLLVVHGERDTIVPVEAGRRVFQDAPSPRKTFVALPGARHNDPYFLDSAPYWHAVDALVDDLRAGR
jgi:hypothetical protein